jgi:MtrB/PioB family decaheme-associated outer membrane protein
MFKYGAYWDRMPHSYSWGALSPMTSPGSAAQTTNNPAWSVTTATDPTNNPASWNAYDAKWKRDTYGGHFEWSDNSPWYIRGEAQQIQTKGIRPNSYPFTNSSGNGWIDLATPVDYKTQNLSIEAGYSIPRGHISANLSRSAFYNDIESMSWQNPRFGNGMQVVPLPPDNVQTKFGVNGALRQLPLGSTLAGRFSYTQLTNSFTIQSAALNTGGVIDTSGAPSRSNFDGKKVTTTASVSLTSNPLRGLDTKLYGNYYDRDNRSSEVTYAATALAPTQAAFTPHRFHYRHTNAGIDAGYRFNQAHKVGGGYDYKQVDRSASTGVPWSPGKTHDDKWFVDYRNNSFDWLTGTVKYENVKRKSEGYDPGAFTGTAGASVQNPSRMQIMDTANFDQDRYKVALDVTPMRFMDLGAQAFYKKTDYDNRFGVLEDSRREIALSAAYGDPKAFRVTAFYDWERITATSGTYEGTTGGAGPWIAGWVPSGTNFEVTQRQKQTNRMLGLAADWQAMSRLLLQASYIWSKTGGGVDFSHNATTTTGAAFFNGTLPGFITDNTQKRSFNLKGKYDFDKKLGFSFGYAYEKYKYDDDQMNGYFDRYPYYMFLSATQTAVLAGWWQNPSYKAHVLWGMVTYKLD